MSSGLSATLVADIVPGMGSSYSQNLTNVNGALFFGTGIPGISSEGSAGLWKSDGTTAGTVLVKALSYIPSELTPVNGAVFFNSNGLWKTDGTTAATALVKSIHAAGPTAVNGKLFFAGNDGSNGQELWVSDGTTAGTVLVKDIFPGTWKISYRDPVCGCRQTDSGINSSEPHELTNVNGTLFFVATNGKYGEELWKSDGTAAGTTLVKDIAKGSNSSYARYLTVVNGLLYFEAHDGTSWGLWRSDGTAAGTVLVKNVGARNVTNVNGTLFFVNGGQLWKSDGTSAGTVLVKDIIPGSAGPAPQSLTNINGTLFFSADDGANGQELWKSDGTAAGTVLVKNVNPGAGSSQPGNLTNVNGLLYFTADDGANGSELWQSDGTAAGTVMVQDIYPGSASSDPDYLTSMNNKLYFAATDPTHGRELWDPPPVETSADYLLVTSFDTNNVLRYDAATGAFVDEFVRHKSGGLNQPFGVVFGPHDHNLYVSGGLFGGPGQTKGVFRYDGTTGEPIGDALFTESGHLDSPRGIIFGPDGNLYVADRTADDVRKGRIARYDGTTGAFIDEFVPAGGVGRPAGLVFGPAVENPHRLDLYVTGLLTDSVLRFNGTTGAFLGEFVASGSGGLDYPAGLTFGPDGNLYVVSFAVGQGYQAVLRFQGFSGRNPGAFVDTFVPPGSGGLLTPFGLIFGPDVNADGQQDLYVTSNEVVTGSLKSKEHTSTVKLYDGVTGAYLRDFVSVDSGGLDGPTFMTFTETDPVTLVYTGGRQTAAVTSPGLLNESLAALQAQPLLSEALARSQATGLAASSVNAIDIRIADLGGAILAQAIGQIMWLDAIAAGWGWFVDATPWDDSEFTTPGNQGEMNRIDLLTLAHEIGHRLGQEHEGDGLMAETLAAGTRQLPGSDSYWADLTAALDAVAVPTEGSAWTGLAKLRSRRSK